MRMLTMLLLLFPVTTFAMGETDSMTCKDGIASKGDTKYEVLVKCGQPTATESARRDYHSYGKKRSGWMEIWTYDFGPMEFVQQVHFDNTGKVVYIVSTDMKGIRR